jgi:hypothetical protein
METTYLHYVFPDDVFLPTRLSVPINRDWDSVAWAYYVLRLVAVDGLNPDPTRGTWYCEDRP